MIIGYFINLAKWSGSIREKAKKLIGLKAKLYNKERRKEKIEMKKKILMHEKNNTKVL